MITRNPSLTDQVKAHIKERIVNDGFDNGRIPPETELASDLGVSRTTVRDALSRLEHEGTIYRRQGAGTFVNEPGLQIRSRLEEIWSYEQVLQDHGYVPSVRVLSSGEEPADPLTKESLGLEDGDRILVIEKVFREDEAPVMLTVNRIPARIVSDAEYQNDEAMPIYEIIAPREKATAEEITLCDRYAAAIQDYEAGDCPAAAQKLEQILTEFPDDGPTRFLLQRCHRVIAEPQGEGERGIIRMDAK